MGQVTIYLDSETMVAILWQYLACERALQDINDMQIYHSERTER